jgi:hypothetical protein
VENFVLHAVCRCEKGGPTPQWTEVTKELVHCWSSIVVNSIQVENFLMCQITKSACIPWSYKPAKPQIFQYLSVALDVVHSVR